VSTQPDYIHQLICLVLGARLQDCSDAYDTGEASIAPGVIFAGDDAVAPDLVWMSWQRLQEAQVPGDPHLHAAPNLVVELLSPGRANERRDRVLKLKLYSRRGVDQSWIVDWHSEAIEVYRREGDSLELWSTLTIGDTLTSDLLPGFSLPIAAVFRTLHHHPR